jgi:hypothetical protein
VFTVITCGVKFDPTPPPTPPPTPNLSPEEWNPMVLCIFFISKPLSLPLTRFFTRGTDEEGKGAPLASYLRGLPLLFFPEASPEEGIGASMGGRDNPINWLAGLSEGLGAI